MLVYANISISTVDSDASISHNYYSAESMHTRDIIFLQKSLEIAGMKTRPTIASIMFVNKVPESDHGTVR